MAKISFCFEGYVSDAPLHSVHDVFGNKIDLSNIGTEAIRSNLKSGHWLISLADYLDEQKTQIEIHDIDVEYEPENTS